MIVNGERVDGRPQSRDRRSRRPRGEQFERGYFFEPTLVVDVPEGARRG
jgi:hypothetical protein